MKTPEFIEKEAVLLFHSIQIAEHGGSEGIRDVGLLESALGKPQNIYNYNPDCTIFELAASYGFCIAKNHPFVDGNKRTVLVTCLSFLRRNGYEILAEPAETYKIFYQLAAGEVEERALSKWLEIHSKKAK
jgi:death on curing protein